MTPESISKLKNILIQEEGYKQFIYVDTMGHPSIGIGRNLESKGISLPEAIGLLENDIKWFINKLEEVLPLFINLDEARQMVLVEMCFNVGVQGLLQFRKMISALNINDYEQAANEILDSKAGTIQAPSRYYRLASIMRSGEL